MIEQALVAHLRADNAVAALVAARIYPLKIPQGEERAAIVYQRISGVPANHAGAVPTLTNTRMQLACFGKSYSAQRALAAAIIQAMQQHNDDFSATLALDRDDYDDDLQTYFVSLDYSLWHRST